MHRPLRPVTTLTTTALVAFLVHPLLAAPASAGVLCDPVPIGDCTPPETTITSTPEVDETGATEQVDATFTFEAADESPSDVATFECRLDRGEVTVQDWTDCTDATTTKPGHSTGAETFEGLALGSYTFSVRATDTPDLPGGPTNTEQTPATFSWTIVEPGDDGAPSTVITAGPRRWHPFSYLGIAYRADEQGATFRCAVNGDVRSCGDQQLTLLGMRAGDYVFTVAAEDTDGNVDPTPARERWTVPLNNTALAKHSRHWSKRTGRGYFQDSYSITDQRGAFVEQGKRGFRSLVLVATRCRGCGKVAVLLGDERLRTIDLSAAKTRKRQILPVERWRKPQTGRVRVEVLSDGKDVILEGIGFSARR